MLSLKGVSSIRYIKMFLCHQCMNKIGKPQPEARLKAKLAELSLNNYEDRNARSQTEGGKSAGCGQFCSRMLWTLTSTP
jgi:hypothetical protein